MPVRWAGPKPTPYHPPSGGARQARGPWGRHSCLPNSLRTQTSLSAEFFPETQKGISARLPARVPKPALLGKRLSYKSRAIFHSQTEALTVLLRSNRWLALTVLGAGLLAPMALLGGDSDPPVAVQIAELKDQLKNGLQARRPQDREFLDRVATMVENEQLPIELVKSTFQWARRKKTYYPFPYFERALILRAEKIGVKIEPAITPVGP